MLVRTKHLTVGWVNVPPIPVRAQILEDFQREMGHLGRDKLVEAVKEWYWWQGMKEDAARCIAGCATC